MKQEKPTVIKTARVACDGGSMGHPKVFLKIDKNGEIVCPYCSRQYKLAKGASAASH